MKVVSALAAVRHLLETGAVRRGDTLLDSSSGIYAYALALACHRHGMRCHIVGSTTVDHVLRTQLAVLGAHLEQMGPSDDLKLDQKRRVERIQEILRERPDYHWMRQYHDDIHYLGYRAVAEHIGRETDTDRLTVVGGVGSGASTSAVPSPSGTSRTPSTTLFTGSPSTPPSRAASTCCAGTRSSPACPPGPAIWPPGGRGTVPPSGPSCSSPRTPATGTWTRSSPGTGRRRASKTSSPAP